MLLFLKNTIVISTKSSQHVHITITLKITTLYFTFYGFYYKPHFHDKNHYDHYGVFKIDYFDQPFLLYLMLYINQLINCNFLNCLYIVHAHIVNLFKMVGIGSVENDQSWLSQTLEQQQHTVRQILITLDHHSEDSLVHEIISEFYHNNQSSDT